MVLLLTFAAVIVVAGPGRHMMSEDDGWAYARSVEHLLNSGEYRLDAWSAASMPVQIYLGAAASALFGYSFAVLESTTLCLLLVGLLSLYFMLRELGASGERAALLALAFLAAPLTLPLGLSFMSDVQFIGWVCLALWLYAMGLRRPSLPVLVAASIALACAIGTRQFGLAVLVGTAAAVGLAWRRGQLRIGLALSALALPCLTVAYQLSIGLSSPTYTQAIRLHEQALYFEWPWWRLRNELVWRIATGLRYVGLLLLPALPLMLEKLAQRSRLVGWKWSMLVIAALSAAYLLALAFVSSQYHSPAMRDLPSGVHWSEALPLYWMLPNLLSHWEGTERVLALASIPMAILLLLLIGGALLQPRAWRQRSPVAVMLWVSAVALFALHGAYAQFNDTYLLAFLPFALMLIGESAERGQRVPRRGQSALIGLWICALLIPCVLLLRSERNRIEALWLAADRVLTAGVPAERIGASRHWSEYHGAFDDWLRATGKAHAFEASKPRVAYEGELHDPFYAWLEQRSGRADHWVMELEGPPPPGLHVETRLPYRDLFGCTRHIHTLSRDRPDVRHEDTHDR